MLVDPSSPSEGAGDANLVLALRAGDARAFGAIWNRYSVGVRRFLAHALGWSLPDVEDLTQEVFLAVFLRHRTIEKPTSLRHFVMSVAQYVLKAHFRYRRARRTVLLSPTGEMPDVATPAGFEENVREARHTLNRCYGVLDKIRNRERKAFLLHYQEEMTIDEVANRLAVSRSTAKRLIGRAAKKVSTRVGRACA
jgi:RNA polymerase sigma-70 factor (ECF subfamily)